MTKKDHQKFWWMKHTFFEKSEIFWEGGKCIIGLWGMDVPGLSGQAKGLSNVFLFISRHTCLHSVIAVMQSNLNFQNYWPFWALDQTEFYQPRLSDSLMMGWNWNQWNDDGQREIFLSAQSIQIGLLWYNMMMADDCFTKQINQQREYDLKVQTWGE